ncbi:MAG TPA: isomerizing glutamine--fructose-6-phosphate transaminase, partial [Acidobacteriota bacterium]|nr:isomerizing glutamine--fructose-6-phosphate transaminase [Acidobacteriota bacterium]
GFKEIGNIASLEKVLESYCPAFPIAIGHTRWATHGAATKLNAHPHFNQEASIAIVHNGILENHASLREMLKNRGYAFRSDTDSEVIAHLISYFYEDNFLVAFQKALQLMEGFWAIAAIHKDHPDQILATARENPLAVALHAGTDEAFVSSDLNAFNRRDLDIFFLKNYEVALIRQKGVHIFDKSSAELIKTPERIEIAQFETSKKGYDHYMLKEIFEQPWAIRETILERFSLESGKIYFDGLAELQEQLSKTDKINLVAAGTSWHAGLVGKFLLEELARIPTEVDISSEFRYRKPIVNNNTVTMAITQSGETADTIAAIREARSLGSLTLSLSNVVGSMITRETEGALYTHAGP